MDLEKTLKTCLTASPPFLPIWFRYDKKGSLLMDDVYNNPHYYMDKAQIFILDSYVQDMLKGFTNMSEVYFIDFGCGSCRKSRKFINALLKLNIQVIFLPIDVSKDFLLETVNDLKTDYGNKIQIKPIVGTYQQALEILKTQYVNKTKIIMWFEGMQNEALADQRNVLLEMSLTMTETCRIYVSADITQNEKDVMAAYDDKTGYAERLITRSLERLKEEFKAKYDATKLKYETDFIVNSDPFQTSLFRAWMRATEDTTLYVNSLDITIELKEKDKILLYHGECASCKYTQEQVEHLGYNAMLVKENLWKDDNEHVIVICFKRMNIK